MSPVPQGHAHRYAVLQGSSISEPPSSLFKADAEASQLVNIHDVSVQSHLPLIHGIVSFILLGEMLIIQRQQTVLGYVQHTLLHENP